MKKPLAFSLLYVFLTLTAIGHATPATTTKPNIVVFLADDMGFADCGFNGCKDIPTPNIDSLAAGGVRFLNGYTSGCVCSPTRAALVTGRYQQRFGFDANAEGKPQPIEKSPRALDKKQVTFAQRFKDLGYSVGIFGKWHVGASQGYLPTQRGFDEFYGILPCCVALGKKANSAPVYRNTVEVEKPANYMEQFGTEALAFIEKNRKKPFFLYLPFTAVHAPFVAPQPFYDDLDNVVPATRRRYASDLKQMDDIIGRVMSRLREYKLEENTLVFFLSDNGGPGGVVNNGPYRGTKWTLWEGGIHVPFVAHWKGRIPGGRALEQPVIQLDIIATALSAAGIEIKPAWRLDGADLLPYMTKKDSSPPHDALFWRFGVQYAVRQGDWKLVKAHIDDPVRLFNLAKDPGEKNDLSAKQPEKVKALQFLWDRWNAENEPPRWVDHRWNGNGIAEGAAAPNQKTRSAK